MKNYYFTSILLLLTFYSFSQKITRGPDIGEIYFLGPTHTETGLYYSTDFGETAVCVDSINDFVSIAADKTSGCIYYFDSPENLYYSGNYGNVNSWIFRNSGITDNIKSGVNEGFIFSGCVLHSEDYGENFFFHSLIGFFGNPEYIAIDNVDDNIGYVITNKLTVADTLYLLRSNDKFENVEIVQKLHFPNGEITYLSRGYYSGELLLYYKLSNILNFSNDFAETFDVVDNFNFHNYYSLGIIGGRQTGEVYILYNFVNLMWQNAHIYIYHSMDYGNTFEVFHPFAKGSEPVLANFSAIEKEVHITTPVEFSNFSIGDIQEYHWDFDNNGIIDSYEEAPSYIYQDTGWYSVKLNVVGPDSTNTFVKQNYIHIIDTTTMVQKNLFKKLQIIPNPFRERISISYLIPTEEYSISIYNLQGVKIYENPEQYSKSITINTLELNPGIYILNISYQNKSSNHKIIKN